MGINLLGLVHFEKYLFVIYSKLQSMNKHIPNGLKGARGIRQTLSLVVGGS